DYAGDRAAERDRGFARERFAQHLDAAGSRLAIDYVNLREGNVGELFVVPNDGRRGHEESDVQAVVAALAIEQGNELVEARRPAGASEGKAARGAIEGLAIGHENAQRGAARNL